VTSEEQDFYAEPQHQDRPRRGRPLVIALLVVIVFAAFGAALWYAYTEGVRRGSEGVAPLIAADQTPLKVRPDSPGGMDVPYQDRLVYGKISPSPAPKEEVRLQPGPEQPIIMRQPKPSPGTGPIISGTLPGEVSSGEESQRSSSSPESDATTIAPMAKLPPTAEPEPKSPTPAPTTAQEAPAGPIYRLQLASMRSSESANGAWDALVSKQYDVLGSLKPVIERVDLGEERGIYYRVQAGPIESKVEAERLCATLNQRDIACIVVQR
jgi:cell division septation protein DedD